MRHRWLWFVLAVWMAIFLLLLFSGCSPRTVYVRDGTPVRLRETIPNAKVWVLDDLRKPVAGEMALPEGWYALPPPDVDSEGGVEE